MATNSSFHKAPLAFDHGNYPHIWSPFLSFQTLQMKLLTVYSILHHSFRPPRSSSVYLSLKEEDVVEGTEGKDMETGPDEVMTESYMTMAQSENCRLVDASIQKNISFDGKPMTPTSWNGGVGEIFSLRDQLKQAEEKASQVQREVKYCIIRTFLYRFWLQLIP